MSIVHPGRHQQILHKVITLKECPLINSPLPKLRVRLLHFRVHALTGVGAEMPSPVMLVLSLCIRSIGDEMAALCSTMCIQTRYTILFITDHCHLCHTHVHLSRGAACQVHIW